MTTVAHPGRPANNNAVSTIPARACHPTLPALADARRTAGPHASILPPARTCLEDRTGSARQCNSCPVRRTPLFGSGLNADQRLATAAPDDPDAQCRAPSFPKSSNNDDKPRRKKLHNFAGWTSSRAPADCTSETTNADSRGRAIVHRAGLHNPMWRFGLRTASPLCQSFQRLCHRDHLERKAIICSPLTATRRTIRSVETASISHKRSRSPPELESRFVVDSTTLPSWHTGTRLHSGYLLGCCTCPVIATQNRSDLQSIRSRLKTIVFALREP